MHTSLVLATKRIMKSNVMALRLPVSQEKKHSNIGVSSIYCQSLEAGVPKDYGLKNKIHFFRIYHVQKKRSFLCSMVYKISIKLVVIWALHCVMAFKLVSSCLIRNGTFRKLCAHQLGPSCRIQTLSQFKIYIQNKILWDCKFDT